VTARPPGSAGIREILAERARQLATPPPSPAAPGEAVVPVRVGRETYGLPAAWVIGAGRLEDLGALPGADHAVSGMTVWRGELIPVLDPRRLLGLPSPGLDDLAWLVVTGDGRPRAAILASALGDLRHVEDGRWTAVVPGGQSPLVRGVTGDGMLLVDVRLMLERLT
jgi:chemotaxis signal transduction protein